MSRYFKEDDLCVCVCEIEAVPTWECIDVNDGVLACLIVDDYIDAKQGHAQCFSQWPGQFSDDIITGWLRHSLHILSLGETNIKMWISYTAFKSQGCGPEKNKDIIKETRWHFIQWHFGRTEVKSEDDSGLETLWLLKKMALLSEAETKGKGEAEF